MTFRVRTTSNDGQSVQVSIITGDKGFTELRVTEQDKTGVYAEASAVLNKELWLEIGQAAVAAALSASDYSDLSYHNQEAVAVLIAAKREEERKQKLVDLRGHIGRTKGWTLLGYKDDDAVNTLIEQGIVKSEPWAVNADRTVYKLTDKGQELHDQWVKDNTPAPVKTYTAGTSATSAAKPATTTTPAATTYTSPYKAPAVGADAKVGEKIPPYVKTTPAQPVISGAKS